MKTARLSLLTVLLPLAALAQNVPHTLPFTGRLTASGAPSTGPHDFTFRLYDVATGGAALWTETQPALQLTDGLVFTELGAVTPLDLAVLDGRALFLGISVDTGAEMSPRVRVASVPYALRAEAASVAAKLGNLAPADVITQVSAGQGASVMRSGNSVTVSADFTGLQSRVTGTCAAGLAMVAVNADGSVVCARTGFDAGTGLELDGSELSLLRSCAANQVLKWNASAAQWQCGDDNAGGTITGVTAGPGLTGGGTTGTVTLGLGVVRTTNGGTGLTSGPTASGQFLRSTGPDTWSIGPITPGDVPMMSGSFVDLTTNQTVGGTKTFTSPIAGSVTGSAATFTTPLAGDVIGPQTSSIVVALRGLQVAAQSPAPGNVLQFTSGQWTPGNVVSTITTGAGINASFPTGNVILSNSGVLSVSASPPLSVSPGQNPSLSLSGVVPVANGGTGSPTKSFVDLTTNQDIAGQKNFSSLCLNTDCRTAWPAAGASSGPSPRALGQLKWWSARQPANSIAVGTGPFAMAFDGDHVWVVNNASATITKIRASDGATLGTFPCGNNPISVSYDGSTLWVVNSGGAPSTVTRIRASDGANLGSVAVGANAVGSAFDGTYLWVANFGGNSVTRVRVSDGAVVSTTAVAAAPWQVVHDGTNTWVSLTSGQLLKFDAAANLVGTFILGGYYGLAFDGANIWVTSPASSQVIKVRAADGAIQGTYATGNTPNGVVFDGSNIWVANWGAGTVSKLRASDGVTLGTFTVGSAPRYLAFDGSNIWVANQGSNTVSKL